MGKASGDKAVSFFKASKRQKDSVKQGFKSSVFNSLPLVNTKSSSPIFTLLPQLKILESLRHVITGAKKEQHMDDNVKLHATIADTSYKDTREERREVLNDFFKTEKHGWEEDKQLSNGDKGVYVFHNDEAKQVIVGYRGTHAGDLSNDLFTDIGIALGFEKETGRFKYSAKHFDRVHKKYGEEHKISLTGHSLGGAIAKHVAETTQHPIHEVHLFNPGAGISDLNPISFGGKQTHIHGHYIANDIISTLGANTGHNVHIYDQSSDTSHPHTLDNFTQ